MQQVVFRLLGPPEMRYKEQLIKIPRRRSRALLYYLACTQTPQPRERLLALLCGEVDEESARHTFKTLLAEVRALLRGFDAQMDWIISDDDLLRFNPLAPLWLDTEIFEKGTAVTSRNLNRTLALYRGDFLDGFFLRDAPGFETWVRSTRDHFRHLYLSTLRRLAELYEADNQLEQAITCTQMLLTTDPLMEEAYASLMRLYWMTGKRVEALREYERLCKVLAEELAIKPSVSTQSLHEQIMHSTRWQPVAGASRPFASAPAITQEYTDARAAPPEAVALDQTGSPVPVLADGIGSLSRPAEPFALASAQAPFAGRAAELAWLRRHLTATAQAGPLILLAGEAGIGKTRLLQEALTEAGSSTRLLFWGTCQEVEQAHPYHAIVEALRQELTQGEVTQLKLPGVWRAQLALMLPDLFPADAATLEGVSVQPLVLAEALAATFKQLAHPQRPVLLLLDDLHWADEATLALLGHLARSVQRGSVFLLGAFCPAFEQEPLAPLRRSATRQNRLVELYLPPLPAEDMTQLLSLALNDAKTPPALAANHAALVEWCSQRSEGNPFLALAWLHHVRMVARAEHAPTELAVPESIAALVRVQLAFLSHEARSLLAAAAFSGTPFDPLTASRLIDIDAKTCLAACLELLNKGLIAEVPLRASGRYAFVHSSVREVVRAVAGPVQRFFLQ